MGSILFPFEKLPYTHTQEDWGPPACTGFGPSLAVVVHCTLRPSAEFSLQAAVCVRGNVLQTPLLGHYSFWCKKGINLPPLKEIIIYFYLGRNAEWDEIDYIAGVRALERLRCHLKSSSLTEIRFNSRIWSLLNRYPWEMLALHICITVYFLMSTVDFRTLGHLKWRNIICWKGKKRIRESKTYEDSSFA